MRRLSRHHPIGSPLRSAAALAALATILVVRPVVAQTCLCGTPADEFVAGRAGLQREWVVQVPFDSAAWRLEQVVVGDSLVVAHAADGTVAAIVAADDPAGPRPGTVIWTAQVGSSPAPITPAGVGKRSVTIARGRGLAAFDARTGEVLWERSLRSVASGPAVPAAGWVYAPLDGGGLVRLPEEPWAAPARPVDKAEAVKAAAAAEPKELGTAGEIDFAPLPYRGGILWCTTGGTIEALVPAQTGFDRLEFDLGGPASGPPVVHDDDIFVATRAGDVARLARSRLGLTANAGVLRLDEGKEIPFTGWNAIVDAVPEGGPLVGSGAVVLSLGRAGMAAFAVETGDLLWKVPTVGRLVAITDDRFWCLEETGFLVARDLATGDRRGRLCLGCFTIPVVNAVSERLLLASPGGLVVSLAPRRTTAAEPPAREPAADVDPPAAEDADAPAQEDGAVPPAADEPAAER